MVIVLNFFFFFYLILIYIFVHSLYTHAPTHRLFQGALLPHRYAKVRLLCISITHEGGRRCFALGMVRNVFWSPRWCQLCVWFIQFFLHHRGFSHPTFLAPKLLNIDLQIKRTTAKPIVWYLVSLRTKEGESTWLHMLEI